MVISAAAAAASMLAVPPDAAYLNYCNIPVLALLFCLMAVVAGLRQNGLFAVLSQKLLQQTTDSRKLALLLVLLCFFGSMFITNDVALLTFVPFTFSLFPSLPEKRLLFILVLETAAANLGSLVTPIGNPQNLFLYTHYQMQLGSFLAITLPLGAISLLLLLTATLLLPREADAPPQITTTTPTLQKPHTIIYLCLFACCIAAVLKLVDVRFCLGLLLLYLLLFDRPILAKIDYALLLTFVCFFLFVGNLARIELLNQLLRQILGGRELLLSALVSQCISNVPAAILLSTFTDNARALLIGVNVGGLGTLVASLASLISYKLYCSRPQAQRSRYLAQFSAVNFAFLLVLLPFGLYLL